MHQIIFLLCGLSATGAPPERPTGNAVIRAQAGPSEIVITTTERLAGAIHSVRWNGKEFIDSFDHGRQLQSAANFDCGERFFPEVFNPTEAGSNADGAGEKSSSRLLKLAVDGPELRTTTQMAFWLTPGEKSEGHLAKNDRILSDHLVSKRVRLGHGGNPHVIEYEVAFVIPEGERHNYAQFEAVTGYMPAEFSRFLKYDEPTERLLPLDDGPGEQASPVILTTPSGSHAMGVYSPDPSPGYGRFRFEAAKVTKWNCVFRVNDPKGVKPGEYRYRTFVAVGTLADVQRSLGNLRQEFQKP
ncbi:hypothetical protein [Singulisphaera acidiphila]|uniref:Uncharacterized protein n=1 Tax=Singulisphaera acidiphila (strain ATCC BAA-1392 / DSM 18658 / VKM B-2454 / MOB10) TaxID=886293 RepID=L0D7E1_SINAD|nr:hypothetical protein [Singulisphaera acidiphila]AGA25162.1 hypothetical protein Sinac_0752 [Singulisphaera acidiphila DSM 18658]